MYIASSSGKIFHSSECSYVKRIRKENRITSYDENEMRERGYVHCSCCGRVNHKYRMEKDRIENFCGKHGYRILLYDGALYVVSKKDTAWKIVPSKVDGKVMLLHQSINAECRETRHAALPDRIYHDQHFTGKTILYLLKDIADHDFYIRDKDNEYRCSVMKGNASKVAAKNGKRKA